MFRPNKSKSNADENGNVLNGGQSMEQSEQRMVNRAVREENGGAFHQKGKKHDDDTVEAVRSVEEDDSNDHIRSSKSSAIDQERSDSRSFATLNTNSICAAIVKRLPLQDTFIDNFSTRSAFVVEQMKGVEEREQALENWRKQGQSTSFEGATEKSNIVTNDTIIFQGSTVGNNYRFAYEHYSADHMRIMDKKIPVFNYKRQLISVDRTLKHDTLVFPSLQSFELFKELRAGTGKVGKESSTDTNKIVISTSGAPQVDNDKNHIIPISYKAKGQGLPLLKMQSTRMHSFRKNEPQLTFRKFKENVTQSIRIDDGSDFETFDYCFVYHKSFQNYDRSIFEFLPNTSSCFKVVMFQASFKPFADFNYKGTRFRVIGTSVPNGFHSMNNQQMKLLVIGDDQPSLCDDIVNDKPKSGKLSFSHFKKRDKGSSSAHAVFDINDAKTYINPIPKPEKLVEVLKLCCANRLSFIPKSLVPFGGLKGVASPKSQLGLISLKYKDLEIIELYQDLLESMAAMPSPSDGTAEQSFLNCTLSVDDDTLVLAVIFTTLKEIAIETAGKNSSATVRYPKGVQYLQQYGAMY